LKLTLAAWCWLLLAVPGCAPQPDVVATDNDNGRHIRLRSGELFDILLADDYDPAGCQTESPNASEWDHRPPDRGGPLPRTSSAVSC
jgi:hypothetical protein